MSWIVVLIFVLEAALLPGLIEFPLFLLLNYHMKVYRGIRLISISKFHLRLINVAFC